MQRFMNKVVHADARRLLKELPDASIDAVIADAMYGTAKNFKYEWGVDPARGDPDKHWDYHEAIYQECRRVLKPDGVLAWGQGAKFCPYFRRWFGDHRVWTVTRFRPKGISATGHVWIVQTRDRKPVEFPHKDSLVTYQTLGDWRKLHPCIKAVEEMCFMVENLTKPGQIILDCFCGLGGTLLAAEKMGRKWIGCDRSRLYCQIAMARLEQQRTAVTK